MSSGPESESEWTRGLLSKREREIVAGEADVTDNYRYQVTHRVKSRIKHLETDAEILDENDMFLSKLLQEAVCEEGKLKGWRDGSSHGDS